jgi:hypothetical protein
VCEPLYGDGEGKVDAEGHQDVGDGIHVLGEASEQCTLLLEEFLTVNLTKGILTQCRMCRSQKSAIQIPGPG